MTFLGNVAINDGGAITFAVDCKNMTTNNKNSNFTMNNAY